jgi:hypothetical protein
MGIFYANHPRGMTMRSFRSTRPRLRFLPRLERLEDRMAPAIAITPGYAGPYRYVYQAPVLTAPVPGHFIPTGIG